MWTPVPSQMLIGLTMLVSAFFVDDLVDGPDVPTLTALFVFIYTLCATQDIAVDGYAPGAWKGAAQRARGCCPWRVDCRG